MNNPAPREKRILYLDFLRIAATIAVIVLHTAAQEWYSISPNSGSWQFFNLLDSLTRWAVPIFVMISGALFLSKPIDLRKIYKKNILRIVTAFIFWSALYAIISLLEGGSLKNAVDAFIAGHYHMWFLYMIIGLYIITPFLKKITESPRLTNYFLLLSLIFAFIIPQLISIISVFSASTGSLLSSVMEKTQLDFVLGYTGYFILGYVLSQKTLSPRTRHRIYIISLLGFAITVLASSLLSLRLNEANSIFYRYFTVNVLFESIGIFVFFQYSLSRINPSKAAEKIIQKLSKYSFGVYLAHALVMEQLAYLTGLNTLSFNPILSTLSVIVITCLGSFIISAILNHIPRVNKYIV